MLGTTLNILNAKDIKRISPSSSSSSSSSPKDLQNLLHLMIPPKKHKKGNIDERIHAAQKRAHRLKKFKEGVKNISFLTYDGTFGARDKVLGFIQQFDAAFGDEAFIESLKIRHVSMHFQKSARQWWASLRATSGKAPRTGSPCELPS